MVLSPSSGPCDATVEVDGTGFPVGNLGLYLVRPGTTDVNMGILNGAVVHPEGEGSSLSQAVPLRNHGCEAAALDSETAPPAGYLAIAAAPNEGAVQPGERIRNIIAVAQYAYTTTTPQPQPTMVLSPSSGPCDATVGITGRDFPASTAIHLDVWASEGKATLGTLASLTTDSRGAFAVSASLGTLGCEAARSSDGLGAGPSQFSIYAEQTHFVILPGEEGVPGFLTSAAYAYTTTVSAAPQALPSTGGGPEERSTPLMWLLLAGGLGAVGLVLVAGSLHRSRRLRS
jgi:hypothetical protein